MCQKIAYPTRREANEVARRASARHGVNNQRSYLCPRCGMFHLTHLAKSEQRRIERRRRAA